MKLKFLIPGLIVRLIVITVILLFFNQDYNKFNDVGQLVYQSILNMLHGINPYSVEYELEWGITTFNQPLIYGPFALIAYLPAMLIPNWIGSIWIGMFIQSTIFEYLFCELLYSKISKDPAFQTNAKLRNAEDPYPNKIIHFGGGFFWILTSGILYISSFLPFPVFLVALAFYYRNNTVKSTLCISLACITYQLSFLFLPYFFVYYIKKNLPKNYKILNIFSDKENLKLTLNELKKFIIGILPALTIFTIFLLWENPSYIINSLFLYMSKMPYVKAPGSNHTIDEFFVSIPKLLYELSGGTIKIGNIARLIMLACVAIYALLYLFTNKFDNHIKTFYKYSLFAVILFLLTTNYGGIHYFYFGLFPLIALFQYKYPDFVKKRLSFYSKAIDKEK
ncbi:MAG: hypothetical protein ACTSRZ_03880 [Promethearchaeota archaeon]